VVTGRRGGTSEPMEWGPEANSVPRWPGGRAAGGGIFNGGTLRTFATRIIGNVAGTGGAGAIGLCINRVLPYEKRGRRRVPVARAWHLQLRHVEDKCAHRLRKWRR